jgi:galactose mutarotase-like enzyme
MLRNFGCRVSDAYTFMESRLLVLENEKLRISVLLDKGSDIIEFLHKPSDTDFTWRSPLEHSNIYKYIQSIPNPIDFRDYYLGGWQEMFPVGATGFELTGAKIGNHGELWGLPWKSSIIKDTADEVKVKLWTHTIRTPFYVEKTLTLKSNEAILSIHETIENLGDVDLGVMWGHHPAFGEDFLDEDCTVFAPAKSLIDSEKNRYSWPVHEGNDFSRVLPKNSDKWNMYYLQELSDGWYAVINQNKKIGFGLVWDKNIFKYLWFWGCYNYKNISPWYGRAYTIAVEPFTSLPYHVNPDTLYTIPAGKSISTELKALVITGKMSIQEITSKGNVIGD